MKKNNNFSNYIKILKNEKKDFKALVSKNSQVVIFNGKKVLFAEKKLNPKIFHIANKIKKETTDFIINNKKFKDRRDRVGIRYYNYNLIPQKLNRFYFVDIKSCYISVLKKEKIISELMFNEINELPKKDRLISLGMLAYEPYVLDFIKGVQQPTKRQDNIYSPIFYNACSLTQKLMEHLIKIVGGNYIFYWVDGIFFKDVYYFNLIKDYLKTKGFEYSFGSCYDLTSQLKDNYYDISFYQKEKGQLKGKSYSIPVYFQQYEENKLNNNLILEGNFDKLLINYKKQAQLIKTNND